MGMLDRCRDFLAQHPTPDARVLLDFVVAEHGRSLADALDNTLPLCLYFGTKADRDNFIAVIKDAAPQLVAHKVPR